ncbi:1-acyl-sn-glycerol-3-phosphate acyltransferase [Pseudactinotalea sp. HY158]|uniref:lysophospholipid acyltransferase family protein n=1 Tax=Pseudactinotalea sp. HY158 TaxID=2654547 RepID=UPI00129CB26E|nr:lysophospholipid acyltransferase family protein [Pseudactinotalea sp. HY158]QGH69250.1 1-acyl-sn-glycerol-3-phosphate acyltransferase [Pseudactinotalea sp. HY158]
MSRAAGKPTPGQSIRPEDIRRWGTAWSRRVGQFLARIVWNTTIIGAENIPATGRIIVAANHTGIIDGPVLHGALPRRSHFIIKEEAFSGFIGILMRGAGQIPVDRKSGRAALTTALALLNEDRLVGVFPEGTRGRGDVTDAKAGVAWLAVRAQAPVVPVAILGTRRPGDKRGHVPGFRARLAVVIGEPFVAADPALGTGRAAVTAAVEQVRTHMADNVAAAIARTGIDLPESAE